MRPTPEHVAISPHGGLYAMPSLCGCAEGTPEWFRAFIDILYRHVVLCDHGKFVGCVHPVPSPTTLAFDYVGHLGTSESPHPPILVRRWFSRFTYALVSLQPAALLAHLSELIGSSPD